jgi:hypothetical protein
MPDINQPNEPVDIFAGTDAAQPQSAPPQPVPEAPPQPTPAPAPAPAPQVQAPLQPAPAPTPQPAPAPQVVPAQPQMVSPMAQSAPMGAPAQEKKHRSKALFLIMAIIVVLVAASSISYMVLTAQAPVVTDDTPNVSYSVPSGAEMDGDVVIGEEEPEDSEVTEPEPEFSEEELQMMEENIQAAEEQLADPDEDGLTNAQEAEYGTDPNNPDTDGDTYLDGAEVEAGYNPLGEGSL